MAPKNTSVQTLLNAVENKKGFRAACRLHQKLKLGLRDTETRALLGMVLKAAK